MTLREAVWNLMAEHGPISAAAIAERLGEKKSRVQDACWKLCLRGLARRIDKGMQGTPALYEASNEYVADPRFEDKSGAATIPCYLAEHWGWMARRMFCAFSSGLKSISFGSPS